MIDGINVKCNYCETQIRLRFQMGYFDIPFNFCCPDCGVHIHGIRKIVDNHSFKINNASLIENDEDAFDYYIDLSVELPQKKITKFESLEKLACDGFSPFMMTSQLYEYEQYLILVKSISNFISFREVQWPRITPLYDLFFNKRFELTKKPLLQLSPLYTVKNELDVAMALHQQMVLGFNHILTNGALDEFSAIGKKILQKINPLLVDRLIEKLGGEKFFRSVLKRLTKIYGRWIDDFDKYIPAVMLVLGHATSKLNKEAFGITTTSVEEMIAFYSDSYELILEMVVIAIGLNNISERGYCDGFAPETKIKDWADFSNKVKSEKLHALIDGEPFSKAIPINRHVRNAIAHYSYDFDARTQTIVFHDQYRSKENMVKMYLVDLAQLCYENVVILNYLNELMYSLRKRDYSKKGLRSNINAQ